MRLISFDTVYDMIIGWREYIKSRFKTASKFHSIGIELGTNDIHVSCLESKKSQLKWVKQATLPIHNWQLALKEYVQLNKLTNTRCHLVLGVSKYQVMQLDKPAVKDSELISALQWSVKEHLNTEDELAIDYFDSPASSSSVSKLNVVAVSKKEIVEIRNGILMAGLQLETIGLEELAVCNLLPKKEDAVMMLKQQQGGQLSLNIIKQSKLYFSRRLKGYENIGSLSPEELSMGIADNLSLEIQRSMDYFESQLRQAPVKQVYVLMDTLHQVELASLIKEVVFVPVDKFTPNIEKEDALPLTPASFASLGAAIFESRLRAS